MPLRPRFEGSRRHCDSNTLYELQAEFGSEGASQSSHGWVMHPHKCPVGNSGIHAVPAHSTKCFLLVPMREVPSNFPKAARAHPTQQGRAGWPDVPGEIASQLTQILHAVHGAKVRESSIELPIRTQMPEVLSRELNEPSPGLQALVADSAPGHLNHLRGTIASGDAKASLREEGCVHTGAASNFDHVITGSKGTRQLGPDRRALRLPDLGGSESLVVLSRDRIEWRRIDLRSRGRHSQTS